MPTSPLTLSFCILWRKRIHKSMATNKHVIRPDAPDIPLVFGYFEGLDLLALDRISCEIIQDITGLKPTLISSAAFRPENASTHDLTLQAYTPHLGPCVPTTPFMARFIGTNCLGLTQKQSETVTGIISYGHLIPMAKANYDSTIYTQGILDLIINFMQVKTVESSRN